ncbi:MAG: 4Fe-4S binding protein [Proteobacteria bacterium]|nr:4Fe-4S binding protein [Pseudomonadota bacterium]MBU1060852.1 4Fe-4S binding protein [Pseudomonadota bacterium]
MENFRYIDKVATLSLDRDTCIGCGSCVIVCPHRIFTVKDHKATIEDHDACMECGACAKNCPVQAINVTPGVGCAAEIIARWVNRLVGRKIMPGCC